MTVLAVGLLRLDGFRSEFAAASLKPAIAIRAFAPRAWHSPRRRQPSPHVLGIERAGRGDQRPRGFDLAPGVPQQHAAHPAGVEVVDHALAERRDPLLDGFEAGIEDADGFIAE